MSTEDLTVGFLPLVDACLPILAKELGFAEEEGLNITFVRDVSWATVLDRLLYGHTDAAHMLAPLAIATTLGLGRPPSPLSAPFVLGLNGNAITLSNTLADAFREQGKLGNPGAIGEALKEKVELLRRDGRRLRFGVVHRFSSHNYKLRYWLAASGIQPDLDVDIVTVSPPFVADALERGEIDGACVGEPWNSRCVERNVGQIVLVTAQIWLRGVEKVLALREPVLEHRGEAVGGLIRAMRKAGQHFVDPNNLEENCRILSRPEYLDADWQVISRAASDKLVLARGEAPVHIPDFMFQHSEAANFPWTSQASWLYSQMVRWGQVEYDPDAAKKAARVFRPNAYRSATLSTDDDLPAANAKVEGSVSQRTQVGAHKGSITLANNRFFDKRTFDPDDIPGYLKSLASPK